MQRRRGGGHHFAAAEIDAARKALNDLGIPPEVEDYDTTIAAETVAAENAFELVHSLAVRAVASGSDSVIVSPETGSSEAIALTRLSETLSECPVLVWWRGATSGG